MDMATERENAEKTEKKDTRVYIPAPTPETGHLFVRACSQKPTRFPAVQKERSCNKTLLFPVSRGRRYNTLYFASKVVCQGDAVPVGFLATKPPVSLDSSGQEGLSPSFGIHPKKQKRNVPKCKHIPFCFSEMRQNPRSIYCHTSMACLASRICS